MGVLLGIIFSHTPDEAKSGGLAKACVPGKNYSVLEKIESLNSTFCLVLLNIMVTFNLDDGCFSLCFFAVLALSFWAPYRVHKKETSSGGKCL